MQDVKELIDRVEPQPAPDLRGDWDAVLRGAGARRRRALVRPLAGAAVAAAALFALALFQPWESESPTFLERALAAVDDGPVLHVVLRGEWGGTLVDLDTGERTPVYGENESWYDPERNLVHTVLTLGGVVDSEQLYEPIKTPEPLAALAKDYREALRSGTARVAGEGVVEGEPVTWITFHSEQLPDVADGKLHEWTQQVAVSQETAEPVATRETRDGRPGPFTGQRVLSLEMLPAGQGDFSEPSEDSFTSGPFMYQPFGEELTVEQATDVLRRRPLWSGPRVGQFELSVLGLTESKAFDGPKVVRKGRTVRVVGRGRLVEHVRGVVLFYGELGDDPATYREDVGPREERPHVAITESSRPLRHPGGGRYVPPEGSIFLPASGRFGFLETAGLFVTIEAPSEELILRAARSLEPMR
jgi:hypothetical protein